MANQTNLRKTKCLGIL